MGQPADADTKRLCGHGILVVYMAYAQLAFVGPGEQGEWSEGEERHAAQPERLDTAWLPVTGLWRRANISLSVFG